MDIFRSIHSDEVVIPISEIGTSGMEADNKELSLELSSSSSMEIIVYGPLI